jgi:NADPH:quinone reductase-like Zn-dependent oxidoreductase
MRPEVGPPPCVRSDGVDEGRISPVVEKVYALDRIVEAEEQIETKHSRGKVVVRLD